MVGLVVLTMKSSASWCQLTVRDKNKHNMDARSSPEFGRNLAGLEQRRGKENTEITRGCAGRWRTRWWWLRTERVHVFAGIARRKLFCGGGRSRRCSRQSSMPLNRRKIIRVRLDEAKEMGRKGEIGDVRAHRRSRCLSTAMVEGGGDCGSLGACLLGFFGGFGCGGCGV